MGRNQPRSGGSEIPRNNLNAQATDTAEELRLISHAQAGDEAAFAKLIRPYLRLPLHVAYRITGNREDAEDASQQSFLKAFLRLNQFRGDSLFSSWLTRIAINEALMKVRQRRNEDAHISHGVDPETTPGLCDVISSRDELHPEALFSKWEKIRIVREAIESLRAGTRAVVWLLGIEERRTKETARILNVSESAVKSRFLRGRQQLRACLDERT